MGIATRQQRGLLLYRTSPRGPAVLFCVFWPSPPSYKSRVWLTNNYGMYLWYRYSCRTQLSGGKSLSFLRKSQCVTRSDIWRSCWVVAELQQYVATVCTCGAACDRMALKFSNSVQQIPMFFLCFSLKSYLKVTPSLCAAIATGHG